MTIANRRRAFTDVVTVDAWHDRFDGRITNATLHAHVHFGLARIGDEPDLKISFRLGIRRAEVIVFVAEPEGLAVAKKSVARKPTKTKLETTLVNRTVHSRAWMARLAATVGALTGPRASFQGSAKGQSKFEKSRESKRTLTSPMEVMPSVTAEGHYRWQIESVAEDYLLGQPWDADQEPRLTLVDLNAGKPRVIEPAVRLEVRCLREDLLISDIEAIDSSFMDRLKAVHTHRNNEIAAECFIRDELIRNGLGVGDIRNRFATITIASVIAAPV